MDLNQLTPDNFSIYDRLISWDEIEITLDCILDSGEIINHKTERILSAYMSEYREVVIRNMMHKMLVEIESDVTRE